VAELRTEDFFADSILGEKAVVIERDGDLWIEGWAADVNIDDQDEFFDGKALEEAAQEFMASGNTPLLYHHRPDQLLGEITVLEPREREPGKTGLWMKARVDQEVAAHPTLGTVYKQIKRGTMKGLSVAGRFFGEPTPKGWRIGRAKFREVSVSPLPINSGTLAAVAGKAFGEIPCEPCQQAEEREQALTLLDGLKATRDALQGLWDAMQKKAAPTAEQRKKYGMADGSFPIWHCGSGPGSVKSALKLAGHGNQPKDKVMAHIRARAKALGCPIKQDD